MKRILEGVSKTLVVSICILLSVFVIAGCGKDKKAVEAKESSIETSVKSEDVAMGEPQIPVAPSQAPITEERTFYNFETDLGGWEIPVWALSKSDHVAKEALVSNLAASLGNASMEVKADFSGGIWAAALVEIQQYLDLSRYRFIKADLYLPNDAPLGLKAKLILTVGDNWKFVEMASTVPLIPGGWVTISANIEPGSYDWKRVVPDEEFAKDVRKVAIRIESNHKPIYAGSIYVDNVRVAR